MIRKTVYAIAATMGLIAIGAVVVGPRHLANLFRTGQARLQEDVRDLTDPAVELAAVVREVEEQLPKQIVALRTAIADSEMELARQTRAISELEEGLSLIEADLKHLAAAVRSGSACQLRGRELSADEVAKEAARLVQKRKDYLDMIEGRKQLVAKLREQKARLSEQLVAAENLRQQLVSKTKTLEAKIALLKSTDRIEQLAGLSTASPASAVPSTLDQLDRDLDRRLAENDERTKLRDGIAAPDPYVEAARQKSLLADLEQLYPPSQDQEQ